MAASPRDSITSELDGLPGDRVRRLAPDLPELVPGGDGATGTKGLLGLFLMALLVGIVRLVEEWALSRHPLLNTQAGVALHLGFYWATGFVFLAVLALSTGRSALSHIPIVVLGLAAGVVPPLIDILVSDINSFRYSYLVNISRDFRWYFYNPQAAVPIGEAITLWGVILGLAGYVWLKTRVWWRALLGGVLAYAGLVLTFVFFHAAVSLLARQQGLSTGDSSLLRAAAHVLLALGLYFGFRPALLAGLVKRSLHAGPCVAAVLFAASLQGTVGVRAFLAAGFVLLVGWMALAQNDWNDRRQDAFQKRRLYLGAGDVAMLELTCVCLGAIWACSGSSIPWVVLILALGSFVYSCEPYRAKRLLPYSLMIEGLWGAAAILCGIVASVEDTFGTPPTIAERPAGRAVIELLRADDAFRVSTMAVIPAAFVGWFLVSAHKDYKDVAADEKAGVQTIYTWGRTRKWPEARVHAWVTRVTVGCIFTMGALVVLNGYRGVAPIVLSAVAAVLGYFCSRDRQRRRGFQLLLLILTAELLGLAALNTLFVPDPVR